MHVLLVYLMKMVLITLTPVLLVIGVLISWKFSFWLIKRSFDQFDRWLETPDEQ